MKLSPVNPCAGESVSRNDKKVHSTDPSLPSNSGSSPSLTAEGSEQKQTLTSRTPQEPQKDVSKKESVSKHVTIGQRITVTIYAHDEEGLIGNWGNYYVYIPRDEIEEGFLPDSSQLTMYMRTHQIFDVQVKEFTSDFRKDIIASRKALLPKKKDIPTHPVTPSPERPEKAQRTASKAFNGEEFSVLLYVDVDVDRDLPSDLKGIANGEMFSVICNGFREGGLIAEWNGYSVFIPDTEIATSYVYNLSAYEGDRLCLKALGIYYTENKKEIIASRRVILEEERVGREAFFFRRIHKNEIVHGKVVRIIPEGAFVELEEGINGFVPVSQISYERSHNPTSLLIIGQEVYAMILAFDLATKKITLSIKALQPHP